ncbi:MAG: transposase [Alphaproteobacteria bacterium]|nr:transposase [Alphaproteobacteria bacterium]MBM3651758.1 transposase [Alphaproteobacteria bacterium]
MQVLLHHLQTRAESSESDLLKEIRLVSRLDHTLEPGGGSVRRIEVITGGGERRRRWSDEEKSQAVEESLAPGAVVSAVARRRGLTPQQLFSWRRDPPIAVYVYAPIRIDLTWGNSELAFNRRSMTETLIPIKPLKCVSF